jgi:hypothetical protein
LNTVVQGVGAVITKKFSITKIASEQEKMFDSVSILEAAIFSVSA